LSRAAPAVRAAPPAAAPSAGSGSYFDRSALPLTSLLFLAPLIIAYEVGTRWYSSFPGIAAFSDLQHFFNLFGATDPYMPATAVVSILLACHILRRDPWTVRAGTLLWMVGESIMYAIPLLTPWYVFQHYLLLHPNADAWRQLLVLSIGAGVYEELVFRLILFHLLHILLIDLLKVPKRRAIPLMVVSSAVLFSLYHYQLPFLRFSWFTGSEPFDWQSFTFRTLAGIYFGMIFLWRGFGLTAGAHASYDIIIVLLRLAAQS
jgi:hypothetical protein